MGAASVNVRRGARAFADALDVRLSGEAIQFLTSTGPLLAEPSNALLLAQRGLTRPEGFAATIGEYLAYTFVSAVMLARGMAYLEIVWVTSAKAEADTPPLSAISDS